MNYKVTDTDLTSVANAIRTKGGTSESLPFPDGFVTAIGNISGGSSPTLITKSITTNGTYNASSDNADGYSSVNVNVVDTIIEGTFTPDDAMYYPINFGRTINHYIAYFEMTENSKNTLAVNTGGNNKIFGCVCARWKGCNSFNDTDLIYTVRYNGTTVSNGSSSEPAIMYTDKIECNCKLTTAGANYFYIGYTYNYKIIPLD